MSLFYGRIIGFKTIIISSFLVWILLFIISCVQFYYPQYWAQPHIRGSDLAYNYSLLTLALILVSSLVKLSRTAENRLLHRIIEQEEALRRAEEIKYRVFDWIDAGLLVVNHDGRITTVNQRTLDWLPGYDRNEMIGSRFDAYFPEFMPFWKEREIASLRRNMVISSQRGLIFGFKMTELPENQGWMILFSDITEVQRLERQVKEMEKLATVGELAAGLAHEMKNPLAGIKTSLQLLLSDDLGKEFSERLSRVILRDIDRLDFLLKDFLIFARPQAPTPQALNLAKELEDVLMPLRLQYPDVAMTVDVGEEPFYFDRNQLHQILINLVVNAVQALEKTENPKVAITDSIEGSTRTLAIADNGPGLVPEMIDKCFDPFVTSKTVGSGLGLAIARRLAAQNGTFIDLSNIPAGEPRPSWFRTFRFSGPKRIPRTQREHFYCRSPHSFQIFPGHEQEPHSRNLVAWAAIKGIDVLATGDFTHPGWMEMITNQLAAEENGLLRLKDPKALEQELPWYSGNLDATHIRFMLCTEISSIYKKRGKVRKIHNLVFMPSLDAAMRFNTRLAQVGNLASDGRPILGLDARDLLEMVLETDPLAYLVPAHIWTPWFSLLDPNRGLTALKIVSVI